MGPRRHANRRKLNDRGSIQVECIVVKFLYINCKHKQMKELGTSSVRLKENPCRLFRVKPFVILCAQVTDRLPTMLFGSRRFRATIRVHYPKFFAVYTVMEDCLRRSPLTALVLLVILFNCSTLLAACKNTSQPAGPSTPAAQPQPAASTPAAPVTPTPSSSAEPQAAKAQAKPASAAQVQSAPAASTISIAGLPDIDPRETRGSKTAPIVIETFSDFQCPACKQLYMTTDRQLNDNYVTTGKVFEIHRDFPLAGHAYSRIAARYSRAAAALGKFEQVQQVLFQNQEKWEQTGDVDGTVASAFSPAEMTKIRAAIKNPAVEAAIEKDIALGKTYSVSQTPTTVIHYKGQTFPISGVVSYDAFHTFLDQLLSSR